MGDLLQEGGKPCCDISRFPARRLPAPLSTKAPRCYTEARYEDGCYLFFGKETKGLPEELILKNLDRSLRLPMLQDIRSLNLSNSVAIAVYEVLRQWNFDGFRIHGKFSDDFR